ncbi:unnamed protein product [Phytophthora fragariaefolia]|uniref:Unnamed protein product n=1 Tax=Phytophthora fragariaefolia TaxID=1490495 RepID=A0A9W7CWX8_9STRA|nr:unnamed protein product [Phytophthora fragariaefolia]
MTAVSERGERAQRRSRSREQSSAATQRKPRETLTAETDGGGGTVTLKADEIRVAGDTPGNEAVPGGNERAGTARTTMVGPRNVDSRMSGNGTGEPGTGRGYIVVQEKAKALKITNFKGLDDTTPVMMWLRTVRAEVCRQAVTPGVQCRNDQLYHEVAAHLEGKAQRCFATVMENVAMSDESIGTLANMLRAKYMTRRTTPEVVDVLGARRQMRGERLLEYAQSLREIAEQGDIREDRLVSAFLKGVSSNEGATHVRGHRPSTLDEAVNVAIPHVGDYGEGYGVGPETAMAIWDEGEAREGPGPLATTTKAQNQEQRGLGGNLGNVVSGYGAAWGTVPTPPRYDTAGPLVSTGKKGSAEWWKALPPGRKRAGRPDNGAVSGQEGVVAGEQGGGGADGQDGGVVVGRDVDAVAGQDDGAASEQESGARDGRADVVVVGQGKASRMRGTTYGQVDSVVGRPEGDVATKEVTGEQKNDNAGRRGGGDQRGDASPTCEGGTTNKDENEQDQNPVADKEEGRAGDGATAAVQVVLADGSVKVHAVASYQDVAHGLDEAGVREEVTAQLTEWRGQAEADGYRQQKEQEADEEAQVA